MRVEVYYNLHKNVFSVRHKGKVIAWGNRVTIENPEYVVREKGRQKVLEEGRKNVHAFVRGTLSDINNFKFGKIQQRLSEPREVTYNPYKYDSFVDGGTYQPVKKSKWARLIKKGNDKPRIFSYE
jgi:hypothetical protein|tara:strand:- start:80 stop:454 length:375 start_codon:yes stop_codon:yes gene_type:complete